MKTIAILLNLGLLITVAILLADKGVPSHADEVVMVTLFVLAPVASLAALLWKGQGGGHRSFLSLYFERRRLEEQKRIDSLKGA